MVTLEQLQEARDHGGLEDFLLPVDAGLPDWPIVVVEPDQRDKFKHGNRFTLSEGGWTTGKARVYDQDNQLLGLAEVSAEGVLHPSRVFNL